MNLKKLVFSLAEILLFIAFLGWLIPNPWLFSLELKKYDPEKAIVCERLAQKVTKPKTFNFFVSYSVYSLLSQAHVSVVSDNVYFGPYFLRNKFFEEITAHELGHIEYNTSNQVLADLFAMKIFGKEKILEVRGGLSESYRKGLVRCYDSNGKDCPDVKF